MEDLYCHYTKIPRTQIFNQVYDQSTNCQVPETLVRTVFMDMTCPMPTILTQSFAADESWLNEFQTAYPKQDIEGKVRLNSEALARFSRDTVKDVRALRAISRS
jgi:hypothetical protein